MIAVRLVRLIEANCDELADGLLKKIQTSPRTSDLRRVPQQELRERSCEILRHLSEWLVCKSDNEIEDRYKELGYARANRDIPFSDFCWAMVFIKEQIWDFIQQNEFLRSPLEIYGEMELLRSLDHLVERAICYGAEGYEDARNGSLKSSARSG